MATIENNQQKPDPERLTKHREYEEELKFELSKMLLSNSLDYVRGIMQILQALTAGLLTAYLTLLIGFGKQSGLIDLPWWLYAAPPTFWAASIATAFLGVLWYRGLNLVHDDIEAAVNAYEKVIKARRSQLIWPAILTLLGLISIAPIAYWILP